MTEKIVKKPVLTVIIVLLVIGGIWYLEAQKPDVPSQIREETSSETTQVEEGSEQERAVSVNLALKEARYEKAPEFQGIASWINSDPLTIKELKGKVVLVDFWTYSCINCIRTMPYLKSWDEKYRDKGLVIVGVHTPEFKFEAERENVIQAAEKYELKFPIAQDNEYTTWYAYQNRFWPHKYLVDIDGFIRYDHIGEGNYEETEKMIQLLLQERMERLNMEGEIDQDIEAPESVSVDFSKINTPEIYLGYKTTRGHFGNSEGIIAGEAQYDLPSELKMNEVYVEGDWRGNPESLELVGDKGKIVLKYYAKVVNIVAEAPGSDVKVSIDGMVTEPSLRITEPQLYEVFAGNEYAERTLEIEVTKPGFKIYTFTFG